MIKYLVLTTLGIISFFYHVYKTSLTAKEIDVARQCAVELFYLCVTNDDVTPLDINKILFRIDKT